MIELGPKPTPNPQRSQAMQTGGGEDRGCSRCAEVADSFSVSSPRRQGGAHGAHLTGVREQAAPDEEIEGGAFVGCQVFHL